MDEVIDFYKSLLERELNNEYGKLKYLSSGGHCHVFLSEDEEYVCKIYKESNEILDSEDIFKKQNILLENPQIPNFAVVLINNKDNVYPKHERLSILE